jgi:hypothetical protein
MYLMCSLNIINPLPHIPQCMTISRMRAIDISIILWPAQLLPPLCLILFDHRCEFDHFVKGEIADSGIILSSLFRKFDLYGSWTPSFTEACFAAIFFSVKPTITDAFALATFSNWDTTLAVVTLTTHPNLFRSHERTFRPTDPEL